MSIAIGPIVDGAAIVLGGVSGAFFGEWLPERTHIRLPLVFGCGALGLGIALIVRVQSLPPVMLALIVGTILGELIYLDKGIRIAAQYAQKIVGRMGASRRTDEDNEKFMEKFITIVVLFCCSGTGIFGSLSEGMTGDSTLLITKSVLDLFTAAIFAISLGYTVATLALPQFLIQMALLLSATLILPMTTPSMIADFTACGGIIMVATGFNMCGIKSFPIANMLPALPIVMPLSALWMRIPHFG
jgi:hypothetical protein